VKELARNRKKGSGTGVLVVAGILGVAGLLAVLLGGGYLLWRHLWPRGGTTVVAGPAGGGAVTPAPTGGGTVTPPATGGGAVTPPATGGGAVTPPATGGGAVTPPATGGGAVTPPATGGGVVTPPASGGGAVTPPATGGGTPAPAPAPTRAETLAQAREAVQGRYLAMAAALRGGSFSDALDYVSPKARKKEGDRNATQRLRAASRTLKMASLGAEDFEVLDISVNADRTRATVKARVRDAESSGGWRTVGARWERVDGAWYDSTGRFKYP
jgi:hypothetical protein